MQRALRSLKVPFLAGLYLCLYCCTPSFTGIEAIRADLMDGFQSYQNPGEVRDILDARGLHYRSEETKTSSASDRRPPFNIISITVENYSHLGDPGTLVLEFFNSRLMTARYYPSNVGKYVGELERVKGVSLAQHSEASLGKFARVWLFRDHEQKQYVGWEDKRLAKEMELWIRKYS